MEKRICYGTSSAKMPVFRQCAKCGKKVEPFRKSFRILSLRKLVLLCILSGSVMFYIQGTDILGGSMYKILMFIIHD